MISSKKQKKPLNSLFYGFVMGICETIPGISASTFALLFGIYEKILNSVMAILTSLLQVFHLQKKIKLPFKKREVTLNKHTVFFLIYLFLGMGVGVFLFSHIIDYLFENYTDLVLSFFVGIIFSLIFIGAKKHISKQFWKFNLLGFLLGAFLLVLKPYEVFGNSHFEIILMGIIAITFGLLPGVSGSFMLLLFGKYHFMINALSQLNFNILFYFLIGVVLGGITFLIAFHKLFKKHKEEILAFFLCFIFGSCGILIKEIILNYTNFILIFLLFLAGFSFIFFQKTSS